MTVKEKQKKLAVVEAVENVVKRNAFVQAAVEKSIRFDFSKRGCG